MGLFGIGKKKEETKCACGCGAADETTIKNEEHATCSCGDGCSCGSTSEESTCGCKSGSKEGTVSVKILGGGCAKCNQLEAATMEGLEQLSIEAKVEHVTDFSQIATYGVMTTPALVINEKVVSMGKVLKVNEVVEILQKQCK